MKQLYYTYLDFCEGIINTLRDSKEILESNSTIYPYYIKT